MLCHRSNTSNKTVDSNRLDAPTLARYRQEQDAHRAFLLQKPVNPRERTDRTAKELKEWNTKWTSMGDAANSGNKCERDDLPFINTMLTENRRLVFGESRWTLYPDQPLETNLDDFPSCPLSHRTLVDEAEA